MWKINQYTVDGVTFKHWQTSDEILLNYEISFRDDKPRIYAVYVVDELLDVALTFEGAVDKISEYTQHMGLRFIEFSNKIKSAHVDCN